MYITYAIYVQAKKRKFMEKIERELYVPDTQTLPLVTGTLALAVAEFCCFHFLITIFGLGREIIFQNKSK
jgi:hypothetical protein